MAWFEVAHALRLPVVECRRRISSSEFVLWVRYLRQERHKQFNPELYYLAQVAQEVRRVLHKRPSSVKLAHFLLRFDHGQGRVDSSTQAERTARSKSMWLMVTGCKAPGGDDGDFGNGA